MTDFISSDKEVTTGSIFAENSQGLECLISEELATYNNIGTGTFTLVNPRDSAQSYTFTTIGIYISNESSSGQTSMGFPGSDPANQTYVSFNSLNSVVSASSSILTGNTTGTFSFNSVENFESFQAEVKEKGLAGYYAVNSQDLTEFENSLIPLNNSSSFAMVLLLIVLGVGGIVLVVLNMINIRERKYEIGVLTAIGMKKSKVAVQFIADYLQLPL